jgi:nitrite reductase/ring-hydroxylating ferredoxin subunit
VTDQPLRDGEATRRAALAGAGLAGAALLAACSSSSSSAAGALPSTSSAAGTPSSAPSAAASSGGAAAAGGGGGTALGPTSEIAVGGGKVFTAAKVVVTQPSAGEYKGFSAVCTHQQCLVDQVADGTIDCPCHGSKFSIKDGSVVAGPAPSPLPAASVTVTGGKVTLG